MAISLAGAVRVPARHRRISLHGFDVVSLDRLAGDQVFRSNAQYPVDPADAVRRRAGVWVVRARMARDSRFGSGLSTRIAACGGAFPVEFSLATVVPTRACNLCGGSATNETTAGDRGCNCARSRNLDGHCNVDPGDWWGLLHFSVDLDFFGCCRTLVRLGTFPTR